MSPPSCPRCGWSPTAGLSQIHPCEAEGLWGEAWMAAYRDARRDGLTGPEAVREADDTEGPIPVEVFRTAMRILRERGEA